MGAFLFGMVTGVAIAGVVLLLVADRYDRPRPFR